MTTPQKQGPPCMSCGWDKNNAPKATCKDKKVHMHDRNSPTIQLSDWEIQNP